MSQASEIQALFDRIAPVYDQLNDWLSFGQHKIWKQMTVKWSAAQPGHTVLDVCCGSGDLAQMLAQQVQPDGQVFAVDFSPAQLAIARQRNALRQLPIEWIEGDALSLPFDDNFFDAATMGYGLRNVVDIPGALKELHRVLKPGATAAILDLHRPGNPQNRAFQQWYLETLVVPIARWFGLTEEYAYLGTSLDKFPNGVEQKSLALQAGFATATHYTMAGATMGVLVIKKD